MAKHAIQYAALPYREIDGDIEVMLVTSRETGRWIIPRGWPMRGMKPHAAARQEAYEEAGLRGRIAKTPLGSYDYLKKINGTRRNCTVIVFPMLVEEQLPKWPERGQRQLRWLSVGIAAAMASDPDLGRMIRARLPPIALGVSMPRLVREPAMAFGVPA